MDIKWELGILSESVPRPARAGSREGNGWLMSGATDDTMLKN